MHMEPVLLNRSIGLSLLLLCIYAQLHFVKGQNPTGFISLDCGGPGAYEDPHIQGISWMSDENFIYGGNTTTVDPPSTDAGSPQFATVRYFPGNQTKYCYSLPVLKPQSFYLVRASFWYGTRSIYETAIQNQLSFKLLIDADEWASISITVPQKNRLVHEIYVRAMDIAIVVCLAGKGIGLDTPFISTIELRPLSDAMNAIATMMYTQCALHKEYRLNVGAVSNAPVRYPGDSFDRIWDARTAEPSLSTDVQVGNADVDLPPVVVLQTAQGGDGLSSFDITLPIDATDHLYYYALYFADIDPKVDSSGQRVFDLHVNNNVVWPRADIYSQGGGQNAIWEVFRNANRSLPASVNMNFSFQASPNSTYGPLINGLEVLRLSDTSQSNGTFAGDVSAIQDTINALNLSSWAGDPCLPYAYNWLNCSQPPFPVRIKALSLSNQCLVGTIPASINNLTELVQISLDENNLQGNIPNLSALLNLRILILNNNSLSGPIPDFLSELPKLQTLILRNNNFSGQVPETLLQRSNESSLYLDFAGNPFLCMSACQEVSSPALSHNKSNHFVLIVGLLAGFLILGWGAACYPFVRARHSNNPMRSLQQNVIRHTELVERSNTAQVFSYHDIETATDNFRRQLGEGGFGPVYHGTLRSGVVVAIKVLSDASRQGEREFLNEVGLLSRVHHKNLVRLVGYCIDRKLVLVYEYMAKGALRESLYGTDIPLDWRTRLSVALDAAEGLEYLHAGCNPRIIHRDVKSANILLNNEMQAKIADFGISKGKATDTHTLTSTAVMGSLGYVDPEYANGMMMTQKIDVYSFGVVLFEILCGQPPIPQTPQSEKVHIIDWARSLLQQGNIGTMVDNRIANECNLSALWRVAELAMMCVDLNGNMRPTMTQVCFELREAIRMEFENEQINSPVIDSSTHLQSTSGFFTITDVQVR